MLNKQGAFIIQLLVVIVIAASPAFAQDNIGFEKGTFENWDFGVGNIAKDGNVTIYPGFAVPGSFTILKKDQTDLRDDYGNFSVFSPNGGKYSMKLGNNSFGNGVQQMSYTLTVPPTGASSIIFDYAIVLVNPGHDPPLQPRFTVKTYNITDGKYIDCSSFDFISSASLPGFKVVSDSVFYKDWASASINLIGLNNKQVRLEFTVNHCPFGYHFGYAYIDVNENISTPIQGNTYCTNQTAITLSAPPGFASYRWFTADLKTQLGTGQYLNLPPPPNNTTLAVVVTPYNGLGCSDTFYTTINGINSEFNFVAKDAITGCPGGTADLTQADVTTGSAAGLKFDYLTDSFQLLPSPDHITQSGLYYIRATNAGGCSNLLPVNISFALPQLVITNPAAVVYPATVDLSKTFMQQQGLTYSYYQNQAATVPLTNYTTIQTGGTYFVKAVNTSGCITVQPVTVTVQPPPPFIITAPNTFTPNNDGINDHFMVSLNGYLSFSALNIYNRNGGLIFRTTNATQFWDGTVNGRPVPTGTYYWVFEGYDSYYDKKVNDASFITVIR